MGTCVYCKSRVPFNTGTCVVCEGPIPNQNVPQASIRLADKVVCTLCGTGNPANLAQCITCDTDLPRVNGLQVDKLALAHIHKAPERKTEVVVGCRFNSVEVYVFFPSSNRKNQALGEL